MAVFPCDWSKHRYPGPQRSVYVISALGEDIETHKLRLCERHFEDFLGVCRKRLAEVDEESSPDDLCSSCGKEKAFGVYVKLFSLKQEPNYFAADLCAACWQATRVELHVASGKVLAAR